MKTADSAIRFRLLALYHNCHSGAAFARCDAEATDDQAQKRIHWSEAVVYETCAGWIKGALDTLPNGLPTGIAASGGEG